MQFYRSRRNATSSIIQILCLVFTKRCQATDNLEMLTTGFSMPIETQHILLINCDRAIEEMMQLCLETIFNCKVIIVSSGVDALARVSTGQIEAILLDIDEFLPDLSWSEIIQDLQQNPLTNQIPIILLTSTPQSSELVKLKQTKAIKAIAKSFDLLNLASQISALLDGD